MPEGNPKHIAILKTVANIPFGNVSTYGEVASIAGFPRCARLVGAALRSASTSMNIPWHRVVNAQGKLSFSVGSEQYNIQKQRLQDEGIVFRAGTINLEEFGWERNLDKTLWS